MAIWGACAISIFLGYRPPKKPSRLDHLSFWRKLGHIDLIGCGLLTCGLTLLLTGLQLGGALYSWTNARVLTTIIIGIAVLGLFTFYEWKLTKTGILHHDLFKDVSADGLTFSLCVLLIFLEGFLVFGYIVFYPLL